MARPQRTSGRREMTRSLGKLTSSSIDRVVMASENSISLVLTLGLAQSNIAETVEHHLQYIP